MSKVLLTSNNSRHSLEFNLSEGEKMLDKKDATNLDVENRESITAKRAKEITHPTSYLETIMHLFKGNIGPGLFAMGDAFKNGGIIGAPFLTLAIAVISVHCQHILIRCSKQAQSITGQKNHPDYSETVEDCFAFGPPKLRRFSTKMKTVVDIFICVTQLGFCCIYFVFISTNFKQIFDYYDFVLDVHLVMVLMFIPVLLPSLITKLKFLAPVSFVANLFMVSGLIITMYCAFEGGLPPIKERDYFTNGPQMALFFGTAIFAFEGIALVLPLKQTMKEGHYFEHIFGVLNVGMVLVTFLFIFTGFFGYLKWGDAVAGSLTLNLDIDSWMGQYVKIVVSLGVLFGYPLQFFIAIQIMWPTVQNITNCRKHPLLGELLFRFIMVAVTFGIAELVPKLNLFISLIGALCSTALALVFPPVIELIAKSDNSKGPGLGIFIKNILILLLALLGFSTGTYESLSQLVKEFNI